MTINNLLVAIFWTNQFIMIVVSVTTLVILIRFARRWGSKL